MKKIITVLMVLFAIQLGIAQQYTIKGKVNGVEDGEVAYLHRMDINKTVDSCVVKNGVVEFAGKTIDEPVDAYIRFRELSTPKNGQVMKFVLENASYEFKTDFKGFKYAILTGTSKANNSVNRYNEMKFTAQKKADSLMYLIQNQPRKRITRTIEKDGEKIEQQGMVLDSTKIIPGQAEKWSAQKNVLQEELNNIKKQFLKEYTNTYQALIIMNEYAARNTRMRNDRRASGIGTDIVSSEVLANYYEELSNELKSTKIGKALYTDLYERLGVNIGEAYMPLEETVNLDGSSFNMDDVKQEYVLLSFTSTGCTGCQLFNKAMIPEYSKIKDKIEIVAYYTDRNIDYVKSHTEKKQIQWKVVSDYRGNDSPIAKRYKVYAIPQFFLLDKDRKVIKYQGGFSEEFVDYLVNLGSI